MSKPLMRFLPATIGLSLMLTGCANHLETVRQPPTKAYPCGELLVMEKLPEPSREHFDSFHPGQPLESPQEHYWVEGYWSRSNDRWFWIPPHWE